MLSPLTLGKRQEATGLGALTMEARRDSWQQYKTRELLLTKGGLSFPVLTLGRTR